MTEAPLAAPSPGYGEKAAEERRAAYMGAFTYVVWGLLPLLFIFAGRAGASPWEILADRCFWSLFWAGALVWVTRAGGDALRIFRSPRTLGWLTLSSLIISGNWSLYIWAVNHGHTIEGSLGYYINPLMNVAVGAIFFRERINAIGWTAVALACIGTLVQSAAVGHPPMIAIGLAATFLAYGVIRKRVAADAQTGLFVECVVMAGPALAYMLWLVHTGESHLGRGLPLTLLLLATGPGTVAPLAAFAFAARRMPLSALAFIQFIGPTIQFILGVCLGEPLSPLRLVSFAFIWAGVAVFLWGAWRATRQAARR